MKTAIRTLLFALLTLQASLPGRAQQTQPPPPDAWPQFRGNPRLTGVAPVAPPATLKLLWKYEAGDVIDSSAAIANGVVYVGVGNGELIAIDLATGALKWKYSTKNLIGESSPTVGPEAVYVGDLAGMVHAVAPQDGKPVWTFKTGGEIKSSPILVKDLVLIGSYDGHLYALESRTGKLKWKVVTEGPVHATPAVQGDLVFIAGCDEKFRAIRILDGKQEYQIESGAYTGASPVLDGDRAYFGTFNYEVMALDLKGRKVLWRYRDPARSFPYYSSAALSNGRIVVGGRDKLVHAIEASSGKALWTFTTRARVDSSPAVAGGRVYVGSNDGRLYVIDLATGQKQWEFDAGAAITASPAISGGRVVVGSQDGVIYSFG
jgi:outer membrane protein assembly factor BamB